MLLLMNSLNESSCCRTRPLASKYAEMTVHASSYRALRAHVGTLAAGTMHTILYALQTPHGTAARTEGVMKLTCVISASSSTAVSCSASPLYMLGKGRSARC